MAQFGERLYLTIGEVSEMLAVDQHNLRNWEQYFAGDVRASRRNGRRFYRQEDVATLRLIKELLDQGYSISGVRERLAERRHGVANGAHLRTLVELRDRLQAAAHLLSD